MEPCQRELSAFHSDLDPRIRIPGQLLPCSPSQVQVPGSGETFPLNTLTLCTETFKEILWWDLIIPTGYYSHGVMTISEFIDYLQPAVGLDVLALLGCAGCAGTAGMCWDVLARLGVALARWGWWHGTSWVTSVPR